MYAAMIRDEGQRSRWAFFSGLLEPPLDNNLALGEEPNRFLPLGM